MKTFFELIENGEIEEVKTLISQPDFDPNYKSGDLSALMFATDKCQIEIMRLLIELGADVNYIEPGNQDTSLDFATYRGNVEAMKLLMDNGAGHTTPFKNPRHLLHLASANSADNIEAVNFIIDLNTPIDIQDSIGFTPLMHAITVKNISISMELISRGASLEARANDGNSALHLATRLGYLDLVIAMLNKGADVNAPNGKKLTPLHIAIKFEYPAVIQALLARGASLNIPNIDGQTPLHFAVLYNRQHVLDAAAIESTQIDFVDNYGFTPIHYAAVLNYRKAIHSLKNAGSQIDCKQFLLRRTLSDVFNSKALNDMLNMNDDFDYNNSGSFASQVAKFFEHMLASYGIENPLDKKITAHLLKAVRNFNRNVVDCDLSSSDTTLNQIQMDLHAIYMTTTTLKNSGKIKLTFAERSFIFFDEKIGKTRPIYSIIILKEDFDAVKNKLEELKFADRETVQQILFEEIPAITNSEYFLENVLQKPFQNGHCYYENFLSAILSLCINLLGIRQGKHKYKEIVHFIAVKVLESYKLESTDQNKNEILSFCQQNVIAKRKKLLQQMTQPKEMENLAPRLGTKTVKMKYGI